MRIECPACAAAYDVPDTLLKPGRPVRCVRCNALWQPDLPGGEPPAEPSAAEPLDVETPTLPPPAVEPVAEASRRKPPLRRLPDALAPESPLPGAGMPRRPAHAAPVRAELPLQARRPPAPPPPQTGLGASGTAPVVAWVASILILAAVAGGLVAYREAVMEAWPPAARLFSALGLR